MLELLALLLPVAAASGWFAAARHLNQSDPSKKERLDQAYFQGMNHLLNEQHDKAIDSFIKLLEIDSTTAEIHFALGKLYRRQGEFERSIRIHQNLISSTSFDKSQRTRALFELGLDYVKVGLLDRAESLFIELSEEPNFRQRAQEQLLVVYQNEKEWQKAIDCVEWLKKNKECDYEVPLSNFYCELALQNFSENQIDVASKQLRKALSIDSNCIRAGLMLANLEYQNGHYQAAINNYQKVIEKDSDFLAETVDPVMDCFERLGLIKQRMEYLQENSHKYSDEKVIFKCAEELLQHDGVEKAYEFLLKKVFQAPSINGLIELLEIEGKLNSNAGNLPYISSQVAKKLREKRGYLCGECGFKAQELHWQCPACKKWAKIKPA